MVILIKKIRDEDLVEGYQEIRTTWYDKAMCIIVRVKRDHVTMTCQTILKVDLI